LDWAKYGQNYGEIWVKVIRFGQNQKLASAKTFHLLRLWSKYCSVTFPLYSVTFPLYSVTFLLWQFSYVFRQQPVIWQSTAVRSRPLVAYTSVKLNNNRIQYSRPEIFWQCNKTLCLNKREVFRLCLFCEKLRFIHFAQRTSVKSNKS